MIVATTEKKIMCSIELVGVTMALEREAVHKVREEEEDGGDANKRHHGLLVYTIVQERKQATTNHVRVRVRVSL